MGAPDRTFEKERIARLLEDCGKCPRCPPHRGDNAGHNSRRGRADRYKDRGRRGDF